MAQRMQLTVTLRTHIATVSASRELSTCEGIGGESHEGLNQLKYTIPPPSPKMPPTFYNERLMAAVPEE